MSAKGHLRDQRPLSFCLSQTPTVGRSAPDNSPQGSAEKPVGGGQPISLLLGDGGTGLGSQTSQARVGPQDGWGGCGAKLHLGNSGPEGGPHIPQLCPGAGRPPPIPWPPCGVCITGMCPLGREPHPTLHSQLGSWVCQAGTGGQGKRAGQSHQEPQSLTWPHAWPAGLGASAWPRPGDFRQMKMFI